MATLAQNIQRAIDDFNTIEDAIVRKGVPVPEGTPTSEYGEKILSIESGVDTSGDTVVPSAMREGYTAHDAAGQEITGTIPDYSGGNTVEMTSPEGATLNTAGTYCEGNIEVVPKLQSKTANTGGIVTADAGYVGLESVDTNPAFEAGKKSEYDAFWDAFQDYGRRIKYEFAFAGAGEGGSGSWTDETLKPKYDIILAEGHSIQRIFWFCAVSDVASVFEKQGIVFDTAKATWWQQCFQGSLSKRWGVLNASNATYFSYVFAHARCVTIEKLIVSETVPYANAFEYTTRLTNLTIEGTIGQNGFNVSWSPLNKVSIISVINALSSTTTGLTVTLRKAAVDTAFETAQGSADGSASDEWTALIATKPNWTINLINS